MKRLILAALTLTIFLTGCGGSGGSSSSDKVSLKIHFSQDSIRSSQSRIYANGYSIAKLLLGYKADGEQPVTTDILRSVESNGYVSVTLTRNLTYTFDITAKDSADKKLCYGTASAYIGAASQDITLECRSDSSVVTTTVITGVAASGLPVTGKVYLKDANGTVVSTDIRPDGSYTVSTTGLAPPFLLKAEGTVGTTPISILSFSDGISSTANINPFTDLAVVMATGADSSGSVFDNPDTFRANLTNTSVSNAVTQVNSIFSSLFSSLGISGFDPIRGAYSADGSGADGILDNLGIKISGGVVIVLNKNTGEPIISSSVSSVGGSVISGSVVTEITQYVQNGPAQTSETGLFITDFYTARSRGSFSAYISPSMDWNDGLTRAQFLTDGSFGADSTAEITNFQIYSRSGADQVTVFFYISKANGERIPTFQHLKKTGGLWYILGDGHRFAGKISPVSIYATGATGSVSYGSGLELGAADPSGTGISIILVDGPGLPAGGIRMTYDEQIGSFSIYSGDRQTAAQTDTYFFSTSQLAEYNAAILSGGYSQYTFTAYSGLDQATAQPTGAAQYSFTEKLQTALKTSAFLTQNSAAYFITSGSLTSHNLSSLTPGSSLTIALSRPDRDILFGYADYECTDLNGGTYSEAAALPITSGSLSVPIPAQSFSGLTGCTATISYFDSTMTAYATSWGYLNDTGTSDSDTLGAALASLTAANLLGGNTSQTSVTSSLALPTSLTGGITLSWNSSNPAVISSSGAVTRPQYGAGSASVTMTALAQLGSAISSATYTFTVPELEPTSAQLVSEAINSLSISGLLGANTNAGSVTFNLNLPTSADNGVLISWQSDTPDVIASNGSVSRPAYNESNASVVLTAALTSGSYSQNVPFTFTVLKIPTVTAVSRVMIGLLGDATVEIYDTADMTAPVETAATAGYSGTLDHVGEFTYTANSISPSGLYLLLVYGGTAYDADYDGTVDTEPIINYSSTYALVPGTDLIQGGIYISALTDRIYRNVSYMIMAQESAADIENVMDELSKTVIGLDVDGDTLMNYYDILIYNPYWDTAAMSKGDVSYYDEGLLSAMLYDWDYEITPASNMTALGYGAKSLAISGSYLYAANGTSGLDVYHITGASAEHAGSYTESPNDLTAIAVNGSYAYAVDSGQARVTVLDVSDPANPEYQAGSDLSITEPHSITIDSADGYMYVGSGSSDNSNGSLITYNINYAPSSIGSGSFTYSPTYNGDAQYMALSDDSGYLFTGGGKYITTFSLSDPSSPAPVSGQAEYNIGDDVMGMAYHNGALYAAGHDAFHVIDASDPSDIQLKLDMIYSLGTFVGMSVEGNTLYILTTSPQVEKYDISSPLEPKYLGYISALDPSEPAFNSLLVSGGTAYLGAGENTFTTGTDHTENIKFGYHYKTPYPVMDIALSENHISSRSGVAGDGEAGGIYAYTAAGDYQMAAYDITDPSAPSFISRLMPYDNMLDSCTDVELYGNYVYAVGGMYFYVYDITAKDSPSIVNILEPGYTVSDLLMTGTDQAFAGIGSSLTQVGLSSPYSPAFGSSYSAGDSLHGLSEQDGYIYGARHYSTVEIFQDGTGSVGTLSDDISMSFGTMIFNSDYLLVSDALKSGISVFDISSTPGAPFYAYTAAGSEPPTSMVQDGSFIYASTSNGMSVYDFSDIANPHEIAYYLAGAQVTAVTLDNDYVYLSEASNGIVILPKIKVSVPYVPPLE